MTTHNTIGKPLPRVDARGKVTGETPYSGDLTRKGMLHMKMLFAGRPHARVKWIETGKAEAAPGVMAVYTAMATATSMAGMSVFGWMTESFGSVASMIGIGGVIFLLAMGTAWFGQRIGDAKMAEAGKEV